MTKIAILTDVHGNAPALRAVLSDIDRAGDIRHIYCLGDMVSIGPDTNQVLRTLFARPNLSMITGNHEDYVLALVEGKPLSLQGEELEHQQWIASRIDRGLARELARLPRTLRPRYEGKTLLMTHYHQDAAGQFEKVDRTPSLEKLEERYRDDPADVVCFGHHHPVHLFHSERRIYVNPGSLGCYAQPLARYCILHITPDDVQVALKEVPYDNQDFLASYERMAVPAREFILKVFHGNQHLDRMPAS